MTGKPKMLRRRTCSDGCQSPIICVVIVSESIWVAAITLISVSLHEGTNDTNNAIVGGGRGARRHYAISSYITEPYSSHRYSITIFVFKRAA